MYQIVTVANRSPQEWYYLEEQFYKSLGENLPMVTRINYSPVGEPWKGLATKPKWLYRAMKEGAITKEYMIFVDSWDLVFAAHPQEVIDAFLKFDADIVISAEKNCFPSTHKEAFDDLNIPAPYCYLNSGVIVGKTEAILKCLEFMNLDNVADDYWDEKNNCAYHSNDQTMWQEVFLKQPVNIALDWNQEISQTLHDVNVSVFDFSNEKIKNDITDTYPLIWHFNGGSKDNLSLREPILKHLNLL